MALIGLVSQLCQITEELEAAGLPAATIARLDAVTESLAHLAARSLAANDPDDGLCPTCGAPLGTEERESGKGAGVGNRESGKGAGVGNRESGIGNRERQGTPLPPPIPDSLLPTPDSRVYKETL